MNIEKVCPQCEHYEQGFCRLVDKIVSDYRQVEEIKGGCGPRGRFFMLWQDFSKRDFANYPAKLEGWRER